MLLLPSEWCRALLPGRHVPRASHDDLSSQSRIPQPREYLNTLRMRRLQCSTPPESQFAARVERTRTRASDRVLSPFFHTALVSCGQDSVDSLSSESHACNRDTEGLVLLVLTSTGLCRSRHCECLTVPPLRATPTQLRCYWPPQHSGSRCSLESTPPDLI